MKKKLLAIIIIASVLIAGTSTFLIIKKLQSNGNNSSNNFILSPILNPDLDGNYTLEWNEMDWANNYEIYRSNELITQTQINNGNNGIIIGNTQITSFNEYVENAGIYYYIVSASGDDDIVAFSNCIMVNACFPESESILNEIETPNEGGYFDVSWSSVSNATKYYLLRTNTENPQFEDYSVINQSTNTNYIENGLEPDTYTYTVIASNGQVNTSISNEISVNVLPEYEDIKLNRFPFSLYLLFQNDNPTEKTNRLNNIANSYTDQGTPFIDPYPNYWHWEHYPAAMKWYIYAKRNLPVSLPIDTYLTIESASSTLEPFNINGSTIKRNVGIRLHLSYYISILFEHICINQSIYESWESSSLGDLFGVPYHKKLLYVPANTVFAFTDLGIALDFIIDDKKHSNWNGSVSYGLETMRNPYSIFSTNAQNTIDYYYQDQLDAMKTSGRYIQGYLNHSMDINQNKSIFGTWWYKDGWFDLNSSHHDMGWYSFDGCIVNLLNINNTSSETFTSYSDGCIGMYSDALYRDAPVDGYERNGTCYMYYLEGANFTEIIVNLNPFKSGSFNQYVRIKLIEGTSSLMWGDLLWIQYYNSLSEAQCGFNSEKLIYERIPSKTY